MPPAPSMARISCEPNCAPGANGTAVRYAKPCGRVNLCVLATNRGQREALGKSLAVVVVERAFAWVIVQGRGRIERGTHQPVSRMFACAEPQVSQLVCRDVAERLRHAGPVVIGDEPGSATAG